MSKPPSTDDDPAPLDLPGMRRVSLAEVDRPDSDWNLLAAQSTPADPFCCRTEWQLSFHEAFAPRRRLHLIAAGDSMIAFAGFEHGLEPVESHWHFACPLLGPHAVELLAAFASRQRVPNVVLGGLLTGSPLLEDVTARMRARYDIHRLATETMVCASLEGGFDGYLARRSPRWRRNLRQAARRAQLRGVGFERCVPRAPEQVAAVYERMLAVERGSWKGIGSCGMAEPPSRLFYAAMLRRLAQSAGGRVMFARHQGRDIGFIFGGLAGSTYRGQQFSYVDDWHAFSIGNLLQVEQIRWLCEDGVVRYDMGPNMPYKRHWTELAVPIEVWLLRAVRPAARH